MVPPYERVTKKKTQITFFYQFSFTLLKCFVFVIYRPFTTLRWLKVLKLSKICLKMIKATTQNNNNNKTADQRAFGFSMNGYDSIYTIFNECGIKLQICIKGACK